jgi:hypothetical protein
MNSVMIAAGVGIPGKSSGHLSPILIVVIVVAVLAGAFQFVRTRKKP